ncbi:DUF1501 domain-containing protein [Lignipirellula cremea]|uniref:DUF1501 domain-containing protein n=1 Tax=Lignipirellula cremea TaxID=2528010 RepID=A0A518DSB8_9BACT|nr:DUF1501 domain-containing protein [Lignipirellula cremea]QDU94678.1 hypothetical protein Pla8534_24840 [Lignipirellula cremea]
MKPGPYCDGRSRRNFLQTGLGGAAGLGLSSLLRLQAETEARELARKAQAKRCIYIWMDGGPSHYETFDPKPEAPVELRGEFSPIDTSQPGIQICHLLPKTSKVMHLTTVIRSISHHDPGHGGGNHYLTTGRPTPTPIGCGDSASFHPSFGSTIAKEIGAASGLPPYVQFALPGPLRSGGPSFLGSKYAPFLVADNPNDPNFQLADMTLPPGLAEGRAMSRLNLRRTLDNLERIEEAAAADPARGLDNFYQQAQSLVTSTQAKQAFDLSQESEKARDAYGRTMVGQQCLLARRLVEAGVPFVTVQHAGWDHHANIFTYLKARYLPIFDQAFSTLLLDLEDRGLLEDTLVLALGEFGRTPTINKNAGRDHWPGAMSVVAAGAGVPRGAIVGSTDKRGSGPLDRPLSVEDFACTLFTKLGIDPHQEYLTPQGRPIPIVNGGKPIHELF